MTSSTSRTRFKEWYATHAFDYAAAPIGSRDCDLQWRAWQAAESLATPVQPAREWIPVGERLPTHNHSVAALVVNALNHQCDKDDPMLSICSYVTGSRWQMNDGADDVIVQVAHWMPLPPPPAADK